MIVKPKRLQKGDTVGVIAPASPPNQENLRRSLFFLEELGLKVKLGRHIEKEFGYLAGKDLDRLEDVHEMFEDKKVKAIICAGGGYGTARIASLIDYDLIRKNPKIFWGYSDITFLHTAIYQRTGLVTFHGPMLASDIGKEDADPLSKQLFNQLFDPISIDYNEQISPLEIMIHGNVSGTLIGGNLSLLTSTLGTPFEIDTKGKLLLIEEINEEPRSMDRMLNQLYMAGKLRDVAGILVGYMNHCIPNRKQTLTLDEVLNDYIKLVNKPALKGFKIGHCSPHISVPLGVTATMNTYEKQVMVEPGIQ
ncbi:muramoyltetrapeptide carboxypeptidase [Bacillus pakistanensis]|uniref:Muramoyltetrapeptide carboxypeptidase n=1 Tax=Rossellomorea pakistanensis TaxID=992288 RepID=A0ABS2NIJ5_9BACI|nr:LD-carboxypeptidase [Bacillus pakistanensis]MBM7587683.1 muramoyltetrapeptide carboxypeptidase [Bacillus pakistanensis]